MSTRLRFLRVWLIAIGIASLVPVAAVAAPLVALPAHPPGFVVHLPPIGPTPLPPGAIIGPIPYFDGMPNPLDPHHWEIELNNGALGVMMSDVLITVPGGGIAFFGNITLGAGVSAYWDIHYADVPEVGGPWFFTATNPLGGPFGLTVDTSVIEYNFPLVGPGPVGPVFIGGPGLVAPPMFLGPPITFTVVPEPATITMALCGAIAVAGAAYRRRRLRRSEETV